MVPGCMWLSRGGNLLMLASTVGVLMRVRMRLCASCCCGQLLNDVKSRLSSLMAEGTQLRSLISTKQRELDGFESDFQKTATQSSQAAITFKKLQAQQKDA